MMMIVMILLMVMNERRWKPEADEAGTLMTEDTHLRHLDTRDSIQTFHRKESSSYHPIISVCVCVIERAGEIEAFLYDRVS